MNYDNNNRGGLWKNDRREKETHPQLKGQAEVDGKQYWVSAWTSNGDGNKPIVSLSFTLKEGQASSPVQPSDSGDSFDDVLDDLPF